MKLQSKRLSKPLLSESIWRLRAVTRVALLAVGLSLAPPVLAATSCQNDFSPERVAAGESCASQAGDFCPLGRANGVLDPDTAALPCDGVSVQRIQITARDGQRSNYLVLRGPGTPQAIYLGLHYLGSLNDAFYKVTRLQELAKARRVLVIVPQAPSDNDDLGLGPDTGSSWPNMPLTPVEPYTDFLDDVVRDVRTRFNAASLPLYVAGLSNGASMVYHYACAASSRIDAIMSVAGSMDMDTLQNCQLARPIGSVIVHGTLDPLNLYSGIPLLTASALDLHTFFESADGCIGRDRQTLMPSGNLLVPELTYSATCATGRRHFLVSIQNGLHYWPGQITTSLMPTGFLDPRNFVFDATLHGYDLLRKAAGR